MIGRQVIPVSQGLSLDELLEFMYANWNTETHNAFRKGRPTPASVEEYILLPATENYMVAAYPRKAGGLFNRENKVVLIVCDTPAGVRSQLVTSIPTRNLFFGAAKTGLVLSKEDERKGPAENALQFYSAYMRELLGNAGLC